MMPAFTVVIPLYNKEPHIGRALRSVVTQSFEDFEVIVVDDASTDRSVAKAQRFDDRRIRLLQRNTPAPGGYAARNLGISEARGEWVAFLDADDEWFPDHLQRFKILIEVYPSAEVLGCGWELHDPSGLYAEWYPDAYSTRNRGRGAHVLGFDDYLRAELAGARPIWTSIACIKRPLLLDAGGFPDGRTRRGGDVDTWLRCIALAGSMAWSPHVGGVYHRDAVNMVTRTEGFTAVCERETVRDLLPRYRSETRRLLKRFANRRTVGAWKQMAATREHRFRLAGKLYWTVNPLRTAFWSLLSSFPASVYLSASVATKAAKRVTRRGLRRALQQPPADMARAARTAIVRRFPSLRRDPAGLEDQALYLSDSGAPTFFGYHDKTPFSGDGRRVLAMSARAGATPAGGGGGGPLVLGFFLAELGGGVAGSFQPFAETLAWCWQQGCMLQWHPQEPNRHVLFNTLRNGSYHSVVVDVDGGGVVREYGIPIYALDPGGRRAVSLNFSRLERLRPGYGYGCLADDTAGSAAPSQDGLVVMALDTGDVELAVSLATLAAELASPLGEHYVNHVTFSPDGHRVAFLHLWEADGGRESRFCQLDVRTGEYRVVESDRTVSHYCWHDGGELLATTRTRTGTWHYTVYDLAAGTRRDLDLPLRRDGHPMFHPRDRARLVTDTYPDRRRDQSLFIADIESGSVEPLARFYAPFRFRGPGRCDLHPRWDRAGNWIAVDTTHRGQRELALVPIADVPGTSYG
jgi:glycosyltransferase involved in cell wall biosynthesis